MSGPVSLREVRDARKSVSDRNGSGSGDGAGGPPPQDGADPLLINEKDYPDVARRCITANETDPLGRRLLYTLASGDSIRFAEGWRTEIEQLVWNRTSAHLERCRIPAKGGGTKQFCVNPAYVDRVLRHIKSETYLEWDGVPRWIGKSAAADIASPDQFIPVANGLLRWTDGCLWGATPEYLALHGSPVVYDGKLPAESCKEWFAFLKSIWGDDPESIACLQEMFGYILAGQVHQQKIFLLVGPPRSGKGTLQRVLEWLLGSVNVSYPTLGDLSAPFGLAPLIGKQLAIIGDARLGKKHDFASIVERLLGISGGDGVTIDRKHLPAWVGRLGARFVIMSNELPSLGDASGALTSRLVALQLTHSFVGKEDMSLQDRLKSKMPGILAWAVEGLKRLQDRGRFTQPKSAAGTLREMADLSSDISAFIRDECVVGPQWSIPCKDLLDGYVVFRTEQGREGRVDGGLFGKRLGAALGKIETRQYRPYPTSKRVREYVGITLRCRVPDNELPPEPGQ